MAKVSTDSGKSFNMRGLQRQAGTDKYEFAYEMEGLGANAAAKAACPTGAGAAGKQAANRLGNTSR